jgi:N,N'-diacetyllegionaminate synthase
LQALDTPSTQPAPAPWDERVLVVAEVAQTHDGSLGTAHAFVDAVAATGAGAIKFQTHLAGAESTRDEPWRVPFSRQDDSRWDYWRRMEFSPDQWAGLAAHARAAGQLFLSSAFSLEAVDLLEQIGMPAWKVASGEVGHTELLRRMIDTGTPIILSSGLSDWSELDAAVADVRAGGNALAVLQCTSEYPCPPERVGLNVLGELADRYGCATGLSDHSATIYPGLAAVALGARVLEVHVTLSREMFGPDVPASLTTTELRQLADGVAYLSDALAHPVDKAAAGDDRAVMRATFGRSVALRDDQPAGTELRREHLALKKPGSGIGPDELEALVGRRLRHDVGADRLLRPDDLEDGS